MKLAIVTCDQLPQGVKEDKPLFDALEQQNIEFDIHAWDADVVWSDYDVCLLRSVWDYHQRLNQFNAWLETTAKRTQIINDPVVIKWNQNKQYLRELSDFGIPTAPTLWLSNNQSYDLSQLVKNQNATAYFLKPVIGADSSDTYRFNNNAEGIKQAQHFLDVLLLQKSMMLQPYLSSVETFGETSAIFFSGELSHAVRKIPKAGDYRVQDTFGAKDISYQLNPAELRISEICLQFLTDQFGQLSYARFDFLHGQNGSVYLNEAELIEPSLFFNHHSNAAMHFVQKLQKNVNFM